jgi:hypothetical protein
MVDDLDAVARGVRNEHATAFCVERAVIEGAAGGMRDGDGANGFQRHDGLAGPSPAQTAIGKRHT